MTDHDDQSGNEETESGSSHQPGGGTFFFLGFALGFIVVLGAAFIVLIALVDPAFSENAETSNAARTPTSVEIDDASAGFAVAQSTGCTACHSSDGSVLVGPSWLGVFGSERTFDDGSSLIADEAYLDESIIDPPAKVVAGFPGNVMPPTYADTLSSADIDLLIAYIASLSE